MTLFSKPQTGKWQFRILKIFLILNLWLTSIFAISQNNLQPGYIVNNTHDTLNGFIIYRNWEKNPDRIEFCRTVTDQPKSYIPTDLISFKVSGELYISAEITFDDSPYRTDELIDEVKFNYVTKTVFLLCLMEGEKSLYHFMDEKGKEHFFIKSAAGFDLLLYKTYLKHADDGGLTVAHNNKYTGQLQYYLSDCSTVQEMTQRIRYTRPDLVKLFKKYYQCTNKDTEAINKSFAKQNQFGVLAGMSFSSLNYFNGMNYFTEADFPVSTRFSGGLFYDIVFPRHFGRLSISNQLLYYSYNTEATYEDAVTTRIGLNYVMINNLIRYKVVEKKVDLFLEAGTAIGFGFNETNYQKFAETPTQREKEGKAFRELEKLYMGVNTGLGLDLNKFLLEARYMIGFKKTDFLPEGTSIGSRLNAGFVMVGYRF